MENDNDYNNMTVYELMAVQQELTMQFEEYKKVVAEIYSEMGKLSEEYNNITQIINKKNEQ